MEITIKDHKSRTIYSWKNIGVIHDDFESLYESYINTFNCNHCGNEFKNTLDRCLDHDHETGLFRLIVCRSCNVNDSYIKYPDGYSRKQYTEQNREHINKKDREYRELYREENREYNKQYKKDYYEKNKDHLNTKGKEWYELNKEQTLQYQKDYYISNKKQINERNKKGYEANKESISAKNSRKIDCGCGIVYTHGNKARHFKTKRHVAYLDKE